MPISEVAIISGWFPSFRTHPIRNGGWFRKAPSQIDKKQWMSWVEMKEDFCVMVELNNVLVNQMFAGIKKYM